MHESREWLWGLYALGAVDLQQGHAGHGPRSIQPSSDLISSKLVSRNDVPQAQHMVDVLDAAGLMHFLLAKVPSADVTW